MAKATGLGDNLYVGGYDLSGDTGSLSRIGGGPAGTQDVTGINSSAYERVGLLRDGVIDFAGFMNTAAGREHAALKGLPRTDVGVMYARGTTLGNPGAAMTAKQVNYDFTRGADGSLNWTVNAQAASAGLQWGTLLTAGLRTDGGATSGTGVDGGAGSTYGAQAFLQLTALTGTNVVVTVEESSDNGTDPWASIIAFDSATSARSWQYKTVTGAVERYVRVTTSGVFTSATFAVLFVRNEAEAFAS